MPYEKRRREMKAGCFESGDLRENGRIAQLRMTAHIDLHSGYGTYSTAVALELLRRGIRPLIYSPGTQDAPILPNAIKSCFTQPHPRSAPQLTIFPLVIQPAQISPPSKSMAYMTMWETTRLTSRVRKFPVNAVAVMNDCRVIIVPNAWNASTFSACGVNAPIRVVPLGADLNQFPPSENLTGNKVITFGTAAKLKHGGIRKGFRCVIAAFHRAFPTEPNVRLRIKCFSDDPVLDAGGDKRIDQIRQFLSADELAKWYASLNVFVSGSSSEGWGRHQHEAMCMGRPVIGVDFGGVSEFFNEENGYAVDWTLAPADGIYASMGHYAKPDIDSMAEQMRRAFKDRELLAHKSEVARSSARRFSMERSVTGLLRVMAEFKLI